MQDPYYSRTEVSNSDLSALKRMLFGGDEIDTRYIFAFGNLIDYMITEPQNVDYFSRTIKGHDYTFSAEDFSKAQKMKRAFMNDEFCKNIYKNSDFQSVQIQHNWPIQYGKIEFRLDVRCKWDLLVKKFKIGADVKSTAAKTLKQFHAACDHFDYFRSRAWYMDITGTNKDTIIGISKENYQVFKINIERGDKLYEYGKQQYQELAFRYWMLFADLLKSRRFEDHQRQEISSCKLF